MIGDMIPFRIVGNVYFVGTYQASSHMIDTGDGLILIDVGYEETADVIEESLVALGYDVRDVRYILLSHGHGDHSDGVPRIVAKSGAKSFLFEDDVKYLHGFVPDVFLHDGDMIRLGNTEILCLKTAGHTEGAASFFFDVEESGQTLRVGMFGGAGANQLKKPYLDRRGLRYRLRGEFFESLERLRGQCVDVMLGNHCWHNKTKEKYEQSLTQTENPFIDPTEWGKFLDVCETKLARVIATEIREQFVNYAHRGASEYLPENTFLAFYMGIYMGANGIETDVRRAKDGVLVLFHDNTLDRVTGEIGAVEDYTFAELQQFHVTKNGFYDKIVCFEDFLQHFSFRDLTFAIELKGEGVEQETAELLRKYHMESKCVVTSFHLDYIRNFKAYAPEFRVGYLTSEVDNELLVELIAIGVDELCPKASMMTEESVRRWHRMGFRVRAWGVSDQDRMKQAYLSGADGMTVNFPDALTEYHQLQLQK